MENQHKYIKGYRDLTKEEIDLMNEVKEKGLELDDRIQNPNVGTDFKRPWWNHPHPLSIAVAAALRELGWAR